MHRLRYAIAWQEYGVGTQDKIVGSVRPHEFHINSPHFSALGTVIGLHDDMLLWCQTPGDSCG